MLKVIPELLKAFDVASRPCELETLEALTEFREVNSLLALGCICYLAVFVQNGGEFRCKDFHGVGVVWRSIQKTLFSKTQHPCVEIPQRAYRPKFVVGLKILDTKPERGNGVLVDFTHRV